MGKSSAKALDFLCLVEHGYYRDGEDMLQIDLGMYYGEESMLPIFYCTYKGT